MIRKTVAQRECPNGLFLLLKLRQYGLELACGHAFVSQNDVPHYSDSKVVQVLVSTWLRHFDRMNALAGQKVAPLKR